MSTISVCQLFLVSSISFLFFPFLVSLYFHIFTPYPITVHTSSINKPHFPFPVSLKPFLSNSAHLPYYNRSIINSLSNLCLCYLFLYITYYISIYINFFIFYLFHLLSHLANFPICKTSKINFVLSAFILKRFYLSIFLSYSSFFLCFLLVVLCHARMIMCILSYHLTLFLPILLINFSFISAINKLKSMGLKR